jgi:hypothetical protein
MHVQLYLSQAHLELSAYQYLIITQHIVLSIPGRCCCMFRRHWCRGPQSQAPGHRLGRGWPAGRGWTPAPARFKRQQQPQATGQRAAGRALAITRPNLGNGNLLVPLAILQHGQADGAAGVDVGVVHLGREGDLGGLGWVIGGKFDAEEEHATGVGAPAGAHDGRLAEQTGYQAGS